MSRKWLGILAVALAALAAIIAVTGCGGSTDHSSEWSSAEASALEEKLAGEIPEFTSAGISCYSKGIEAAFPPSEAGGESASSDSGKEVLEGIAKKCTESSANVQGTLSQACQEEGLLGQRCQEEVVNEDTEGVEEELGLGSESESEEEPYAEENEYENKQGYEELNEELKQEEQESVENGEEPATP